MSSRSILQFTKGFRFSKLRLQERNTQQHSRQFHASSTFSSSSLAKLVAPPVPQLSHLPNGLRVASEDWRTPTCTISLYVGCGSKLENDDNNGVSHFLEHMIFKGIPSLKQHDLEAQVEKNGAELHAHTTREYAVYSARCHQKDVGWAVELLGKLIKNNLFDDTLLEQERKVILQELKEAEHNYKQVVFDYLHGVAYQGTPLCRTIYGPEENVRKLGKNDLERFVNNYYKASRMVLCAAGGVEHSALLDLANKHLGDVSNQYTEQIPVIGTPRFTGGDIRDRDDAMPLAHGVLAFEGPPAESSDNVALMVASAVHGSWDRDHTGAYNSGSDLALRFATGHDSSIMSFEHFHHSYRDTSLWGVYVTVPQIASYEGIWFIQEEWISMATGIRDIHVERAKNNLKRQLLQRARSGTSAICEDIGKQVLLYDRRIPVSEMLTRIDHVTTLDVKNVLMKYTYDRCPAVACIGPIEAFPDYSEIRSHTWWVRY